MIHFEILVEDSSGQRAIEHIFPKLLDGTSTFKAHAYKGIGRLPPGLTPGTDASKRILLDQLPKILSGYGKAFRNDPPEYKQYVVVICDLDKRDQGTFEAELEAVVQQCNPAPPTLICLSVEEGEAWLLGDKEAVRAAYPNSDAGKLAAYEYDAICDTWERLADIVEDGGAAKVKEGGFVEAGKRKHQWAEKIAPLINPPRNESPSFKRFVAKIASILPAEEELD